MASESPPTQLLKGELWDTDPNTFLAREAIKRLDLKECYFSDDAVMKFLVNKKERTITGVNISRFNEAEFAKGGILRSKHKGRGVPAPAPDGTVMTVLAGYNHATLIVLNGGDNSLIVGSWTIENFQEKSDQPGYNEWLSKAKWTAADALRAGIPLTSINATVTSPAEHVQQTPSEAEKNSDDPREKKADAPQLNTNGLTNGVQSNNAGDSMNQGQENITPPEKTPSECSTLSSTYSEITASKSTTPEPSRLEADHLEVASSEVSVSEPATSEPVIAEPATLEPVISQAATSKIAVSEPAISEPPISEPATSDFTASQPATLEPAASDLAASQPPASEPASSEPIASQLIASDPPGFDPATLELATSEPIVSTPSVSESAAPQPVASEPAASKFPVLEAATLKRSASEPATTEPTASEPAALEPIALKRGASEPTPLESFASTSIESKINSPEASKLSIMHIQQFTPPRQRSLEIPETPPPSAHHPMNSETQMPRERTPIISPEASRMNNNHATKSTERSNLRSPATTQPASATDQATSSQTQPPTPLLFGSLERQATKPLDKLVTFYVGDGHPKDMETFNFSERKWIERGPEAPCMTSTRPKLFEAILHWIDKGKVMRKSYSAPDDLECYYLDLYVAAAGYRLPVLSNAIIDKLYDWHRSGTVQFQKIDKVYSITEPGDGLRRFYFGCMMALSVEEFEATSMEEPSIVVDLFALKKAAWAGMEPKEAYHDA
ncbi:hypothetical protein VE02_02558 [Pseudogymnoascus sp. 03VT05]|nr:hypothetical protein VE02_02558 [Pseudogymnoascus sp. 03VT05]